MVDVLIVGAGAAGLRCAEVAASRGLTVRVVEKGRALGRKFLVAGKSGLNLTHAEEFEVFASRYHASPEHLPWLREVLARFDNIALRQWAADLGVETFVASSGRVYPVEMKGGRLFRRWIERLRSLGVEIETGWTLREVATGKATFEQEGERCEVRARRIVLALGGASWSWTGSDGSWTSLFSAESCAPWQPANCGWEVAWPADLVEKIDGLVLKNVIATTGEHATRGELRITRYGLEGGPVYRLGPFLRAPSPSTILHLDLKADLSAEQLRVRLRKCKRLGPRDVCRQLKLPREVAFLLTALTLKWQSLDDAVRAVEALPLPLTGPRPLEEAISSAGGLRLDHLEPDFDLKNLPKVHAIGEMLDWEAPTGGYLLQMCFAMGTWTGEALASEDSDELGF